MKSLYNFFVKYLPKEHYELNKVLIMINPFKTVRYIYSFDRRKNVIYTTYEDKTGGKYMSLYELEKEGWKVIHKYQLEFKMKKYYTIEENLPF